MYHCYSTTFGQKHVFNDEQWGHMKSLSCLFALIRCTLNTDWLYLEVMCARLDEIYI